MVQRAAVPNLPAPSERLNFVEEEDEGTLYSVVGVLNYYHGHGLAPEVSEACIVALLGVVTGLKTKNSHEGDGALTDAMAAWLTVHGRL